MSQASEASAARTAGAEIFAEAKVVASYHGRAPYAPAAYQRLLGEVAGRGRLLDLGCGPGTIALALAPHFAEVVALDPSDGMLRAGQAAAARAGLDNIRWTPARVEDFDDAGGFDLATSGSSIHWMDPAVLFPKLAAWTPVLATLANDVTFPDPPPPCGYDAWVGFLETWFARTGRTTPAAWRDRNLAVPAPTPHEAWMEVAGKLRFDSVHRQSVEAFIASCHSRANWSGRWLGAELAGEFEAALDALLRPHTGADGLLAIPVVTELTWGTPRVAPDQD